MNVLDLFSGIGGFSLGLERAGMRTVAFCEIEPYCRSILAERWPGIDCAEDVQTREHRPGEARVITAGFPCQDISNSGYGAGLAGARSGLWREVVRAFRVVGPQYGLLENVAALLDRGMGEVLGDLAEIGYDAEWHCIPASCVGLPHVRDRLWIVANDHRQRGEGLGPLALSGLYSVPWRENERGAANWRGRPDLHGPYLCGSGHGVSPRLDAIGNAVTPLIPEIIGRAIMNAHN